MQLNDAVIMAHTQESGDYRLLTLDAGDLALAARPGQFVHLRVSALGVAALRRPFSICAAEGSRLELLYKAIGRGTEAMTHLVPGDKVSLMGPLGNGFPVDMASNVEPLLVAGGYGVAPLYFLASRLNRRGVLLVGGRGAEDILCVERFEALGWTVCVATEDGSCGASGLVTSLLPSEGPTGRSREGGECTWEIFACGPDGMLRAVGDWAMARGLTAWLSLDKHMGCAVGACLACVQHLRKPDGSVELGRVCRDGPVFEARSIVWDRAQPPDRSTEDGTEGGGDG